MSGDVRGVMTTANGGTILTLSLDGSHPSLTQGRRVTVIVEEVAGAALLRIETAGESAKTLPPAVRDFFEYKAKQLGVTVQNPLEPTREERIRVAVALDERNEEGNIQLAVKIVANLDFSSDLHALSGSSYERSLRELASARHESRNVNADQWNEGQAILFYENIADICLRV